MKSLGQFFTPAWAAELLFDAHFSHLTSNDLVWEPTCGRGYMLAAIPKEINCIGTEIDPQLASYAREQCGRNVIVGDCRTVDFPQSNNVTAVFGNPPFDYRLFTRLMDRCALMLAIGRKAGFILPAYFLQTSRTVNDLSRKWSIESEIIPRDIFPGLSKPLVFGTFYRDNQSRLIGFRLFSQQVEVRELPEKYQDMLRTRINGSRSVEWELVGTIINELGGQADLDSIYKKMEGKRPTENPFWKEQVRKVLQQSFVKVSRAKYSIN